MAGQPSKYNPKYCHEVIEHMKEGYSLESFAGKIGVCKDSLYAWKDAHPEFSDAIKMAQAACQFKWEHRLGQAVTDPKGMNVTPIIFALKCRFGYKETTAHEHSGPDGKPIEHKNLTDLKEDQLDDRIKTLTEKIGINNG